MRTTIEISVLVLFIIAAVFWRKWQWNRRYNNRASLYRFYDANLLLVKVPAHRHFRAIADCPESVIDPTELELFVWHVRTCRECQSRLRTARELDRRFIEPISRNWRHLSEGKLRQMKQNGFDPEAVDFGSTEEWHLSVCVDCQERFEKL